MFTRERLTRWTSALRANPQKQYKNGGLANSDYTKTCCLGELCEVEGLKHASNIDLGRFAEHGLASYGILHKRWQLTKDFGSNCGTFREMGMPNLHYKGNTFYSAISANDDGVPWPVIADHFDTHYPCADD